MKKRKNITSKISLIITILLTLFLIVSGYNKAQKNLLVETKIEEKTKKKNTDYPTANLSYLTVQINERVNMTVTAPDGKVSNKESSDIEYSHFTRELPLGNYLYPEKSSGNPYWEFDKKYPHKGVYTIFLQSNEPVSEKLYIFSIAKRGGSFIEKKFYDIDSKGITLLLHNDPDDSKNTYITVK